MTVAPITVESLWVGEPADLLESRARRTFRNVHGFEAEAVRRRGNVAVAFGPGWGTPREQLCFLWSEYDSLGALRRERARETARRLSSPTLPSLHERTPAMDRTTDLFIDWERTLSNPSTFFPSAVRRGAVVRLKHRGLPLSVELTVGQITQAGIPARTTHIAVDGDALTKYAAVYWELERVVKPAPTPLPTVPGVYVLDSARELYEAGRPVEVLTLLPGDGSRWTLRYGAGAMHSWTPERVSAFVDGRKLVRLTPEVG